MEEQEEEKTVENEKAIGQKTERKKRKRISKVWADIQEEKDGTKRCMICDKKFAASTSTASLRYHVQKKHGKSGRSVDNIFDPEVADNLLGQFIIRNGLSLRLVESEKFEQFVSYLRSGYKPPSRKKLTAVLLTGIWEEIEAGMKEKMLSIKHYSISLDSWTAEANLNYIAATAHAITKDWALESFLLGVFLITESETAVFIADVVEELL
jgi:hypothetical protein